jgi:hypothetical protein
MAWIAIPVIAAVLIAAVVTRLCLAKPAADKTENPKPSAPADKFVDRDQMLNMVQRDHFNFFRINQHPKSGMVLDRNTPTSPASIASIGFALTVYPVAVERGWCSRAEAVDFTLRVLRNLSSTPQGTQDTGVSGHKGFFYHFLDPDTGCRSTAPGFGLCELSSIDTALMMAGVLFAQEYFTRDDAAEAEIRSLADALYKRVEWDWMSDANGEVYMAWFPDRGFSKELWHGYSEGQLIYVLGMGSPTHPLRDGAWNAHIMHVQPTEHYGREYVLLTGGPLFTYQYAHCWIPFLGIRDDKARQMGFDWFENARRATMSQIMYAMDNPMRWRGYSVLNWGLTACDGPGGFKRVVNGVEREFRGYSERGCPGGFDDGTIAPTAAISAMPFTPNMSLRTLEHWLTRYPELYTPQGFRDSFNPTLDTSRDTGWVNVDSIGIDQGPIVLMIENYRSGFCWDVMKRSAALRTGLRRAHFRGGWLDEKKAK